MKTREETYHPEVEAKKKKKMQKAKKKDKNARDIIERFLPESIYLQFLMESLLMDQASEKERTCEFIRVSVRQLHALCFPKVRHQNIKKTLVDKNINVILIMPTISNLDEYYPKHSITEWMNHLIDLEKTFDANYNITFYPRINYLVPFMNKHIYMEVLKEEAIKSYVYPASSLPSVEELSSLDFPFTTYTGEVCKTCGDGGVITSCDACEHWYHIDMSRPCISISKRLSDPSKVGTFICDEW